ncbi:MAG: glycosyltransferase [Candidatus Moranbacteria bacterium]|nr:glycosyltransferase [Candidatus Moranbacteria bacterium]
MIFIPSHSLSLIHPPFLKASKIKHPKKVYVLHGLEIINSKEYYGFRDRILHAYLIKHSLKKADQIISVSQTSTNLAKKFFKIPDFKITTLYQSVKITNCSNQQEKPNFKNYFLFLGNWTPRKNILNLIKAFCLLKKSKKISRNTKLILLGDKNYNRSFINRIFRNPLKKDYQASVIELIKKSKFKKSIILLNYSSDENRDCLIKNAKALVMPSFDEGFGRTVLESLFLKTPVIISNIPVFKEIYGDTKKGVTFINPDKPKNIANALYKTLKNNKKPTKDDIQNLKLKYDWEKISKKVIEILI